MQFSLAFRKGLTQKSCDEMLKPILIVFSALFVGMEAYALSVGSRYKWDFLAIMVLFLAVYLIRKKIDLQATPFAMFGVFLFLHFAGMFGWYSSYPLGMEYDHWVHGFFGFIAALMVLRAYHYYGVYPAGFIPIAATAVILGFSALHEIFEYGGAMLLGEGEGVLFVGAGDLDEWDTQKDMLNNLIGAIVGLIVFYSVRGGLKKPNPA